MGSHSPRRPFLLNITKIFRTYKKYDAASTYGIKRSPRGRIPGGQESQSQRSLRGDLPGWEACLGSALGGSGKKRERRPAGLSFRVCRLAWLRDLRGLLARGLSALGEVRSFWLSPADEFSQPLVADQSRRETLARNVANPRHRPSATLLAADPVARPPRERNPDSGRSSPVYNRP